MRDTSSALEVPFFRVFEYEKDFSNTKYLELSTEFDFTTFQLRMTSKNNIFYFLTIDFY